MKLLKLIGKVIGYVVISILFVVSFVTILLLTAIVCGFGPG